MGSLLPVSPFKVAADQSVDVSWLGCGGIFLIFLANVVGLFIRCAAYLYKDMMPIVSLCTVFDMSIRSDLP
jgi:hypothetical protein